MEGITRHDWVREGGEQARCPNCGKILDDKRVGSGQLAEGEFCSLGCMLAFHHGGEDTDTPAVEPGG
jgi:hypothetical protein